jgi:sugar/nucleoside kinase (ribokinase family)
LTICAEQRTGSTGMAVLPVYTTGARGCFYDPGANAAFEPQELIAMITESTTRPVAAFVFGYPHLLKLMHGEHLRAVFKQAHQNMIRSSSRGGVTVLDLNGVPAPSSAAANPASVSDDPVIGRALGYVDIVHLNEEELNSIAGHAASSIEEKAQQFIAAGAAVVAVTLGAKGCYIACGDANRFSACRSLPKAWIGLSGFFPAAPLESSNLNVVGAGDAFTAGLLTAALIRIGDCRGSRTYFDAGVVRPASFSLEDPEAVRASERAEERSGASQMRKAREESERGSTTPSACVVDMCGRAHVRPSAAHVRPSAAHVRPSTCATSPAAGGVRGVSPRQPFLWPASAADVLFSERKKRASQPHLAGSRGGSWGLPPTTAPLARFRCRRASLDRSSGPLPLQRACPPLPPRPSPPPLPPPPLPSFPPNLPRLTRRRSSPRSCRAP